MIGLPLGLGPTGSCEQADARLAKAAASMVETEERILKQIFPVLSVRKFQWPWN